MNDATNKDDNPFWRYALKQYGNMGAESHFLRYQDELGVDVNMLLYCGWLATQQKLFCADDDPIQQAMLWQSQVVLPLRQVRRASRAFIPFPALIADLRPTLKQIELDCEQQQLWCLYRAAEKMETRLAPFDALAAQNIRVYLCAAKNGNSQLGTSRKDAEESNNGDDLQYCEIEQGEWTNGGENTWIQATLDYLNPNAMKSTASEPFNL